MTKFKKVLGVCLGVYLFAALSLAQAQNAPGPDGHALKWHSGQIFRQLGLTDDQKKQLEANKVKHRAVMQSVWREIGVDKKVLREELMKPQLDMSRIDQIHDQIKSLQDQMEDEKLNSILAVRTILTPDQFLKFVNLMHKHKQEHEGAGEHE